MNKKVFYFTVCVSIFVLIVGFVKRLHSSQNGTEQFFYLVDLSASLILLKITCQIAIEGDEDYEESKS